MSDAPLPEPAPLTSGRAARTVSYGFSTQPGWPSQPTSSRWTISDDRFDSVQSSPRTTLATPKANFYTLAQDERAWRGDRYDPYLRGGKTFAFPPLPFGDTARADPLKARVDNLLAAIAPKPHTATGSRGGPGR